MKTLDFDNTPRGYTSTQGCAQWLESRFQAGARESSAALTKALQGLTRAALAAFIRQAGSMPEHRGKKPDLIVHAHILQMMAWYPEKKIEKK